MLKVADRGNLKAKLISLGLIIISYNYGQTIKPLLHQFLS